MSIPVTDSVYVGLMLPLDPRPISPEAFERQGISAEALDEVRSLLLPVLPRTLKSTVNSWCARLPPTGMSGLVRSECYQNFVLRTELRPTRACSPIQQVSRSTDRYISPTTPRILVQ